MQVFAFLPTILAPPPDAPLAVSGVSELYRETYVNVFGRDALLAEKASDDSLVVFHPLNDKLLNMSVRPLYVGASPSTRMHISDWRICCQALAPSH
jgi:hypothetical protein